MWCPYHTISKETLFWRKHFLKRVMNAGILYLSWKSKLFAGYGAWQKWAVVPFYLQSHISSEVFSLPGPGRNLELLNGWKGRILQIVGSVSDWSMCIIQGFWLAGGAKRIVQVVELEDNQVFGGASLKWVVIPGQRQRTIGRHISLNLHTLTPSAANPANAHFNPILTHFCCQKSKIIDL